MQNSDLIQKLQPYLQQAEITVYHGGHTLHITDVEALFGVSPREALAVLLIVEERPNPAENEVPTQKCSAGSYKQTAGRAKRDDAVGFRVPNAHAMHIEDAQANGFIVDTHCYPHLGYKGERFRPTETCECYTKLETQLIRREIKSLVEFTNEQLGEPWKPEPR